MDSLPESPSQTIPAKEQRPSSPASTPASTTTRVDRPRFALLRAIQHRLGFPSGHKTTPEDTLRTIASSGTWESEGTEKQRLFDWNRAEPPSRSEVLRFLQKFPQGTGREQSVYRFSSQENQWEIVTKELVDGLVGYFETRIQELGKSSGNPLRIVEVGAGSGRLAHFVRKALEKKGLGEAIKYIATERDREDHKWPNPEVQHGVDYRYALTLPALEGKPADIVISSWPAPRRNLQQGEDWTPAFREAGVGEYILLGNPRVCADAWNSWGVMANFNKRGFDKITTDQAIADYQRKQADGTLRPEEKPLYETDGLGYRKVEVPSLQAIPLLGASDYYNNNETSSSRLVLFRRT